MGGRFTVGIRSIQKSIAGYVTETCPDYGGNLSDNERYVFSLKC